jgi:predicted double-glycine peptidase
VNLVGTVMIGTSAFFALVSSFPCAAGELSFMPGGLRLTTDVRSMAEIRDTDVLRQRWDYSCGSAAISTVLTYFLDDPTPETAVVVSILRRTDPVRVRSRGGFSLLDLKNYLTRRGYTSSGFADLDLDDLSDFAVPPIVPISLKGFDHFVVFRGHYGDRVVLTDPAFGNLTMSASRFIELWKDGIGFVVTGVPRQDSAGRLDIAELPFANRSVIRHLTSGSSFRTVDIQ